MYGAGHSMDFINRMRFNRGQLKNRKKFKSDEKTFHKVETSTGFKNAKLKNLKHLSEEEFLEYKQKLHQRLRRERYLFLLKMLLGAGIVSVIIYFLILSI